MAILPFLVLLNSWQKAFAVNGTQILINISTVAQITCLHLQDVEGGKLAVLQTVDFKKVFEFFGVIVIEADDHNPEKNQSVKDVLLANGFDYFSHIGANDWFVNKKFTHCDDAKLQ